MNRLEKSSLSAIGCLLVIGVAFGSSFLSFLCSRCDSWDEVSALRFFNFLVIGPLWSVAAFLCFKGKARAFLIPLAFILSAGGLSAFQETIARARLSVSRSVITLNVMQITVHRIQAYMKSHRKVPSDLSVLPVEDGLFNKPVDGWGHDLQYSVDGDGVITLTSLGADGKPGGEDTAADIVRRYRTLNGDGVLNVDDDLWINNAEIK